MWDVMLFVLSVLSVGFAALSFLLFVSLASGPDESLEARSRVAIILLIASLALQIASIKNRTWQIEQQLKTIKLQVE